MSEQSPEKAALNEEPEVEGHKKALRPDDDPSAFARSEEPDEGPEVEGHVKARGPEDPQKKA